MFSAILNVVLKACSAFAVLYGVIILLAYLRFLFFGDPYGDCMQDMKSRIPSKELHSNCNDYANIYREGSLEDLQLGLALFFGGLIVGAMAEKLLSSKQDKINRTRNLDD